MSRLTANIASVVFFFSVIYTSEIVIADDQIKSVINRIGYWHMHIKQTTINSGKATVERDFDHCYDLRNPVPPVNKLSQFMCPVFNVQKDQRSLHTRAECTFANNGHLTGRTDVEIGRDGVTASFRQEVHSSWINATGSQASVVALTTGRLTGDCPAGTAPVSIQPVNPVETYVLHHNH